MSAMFKSLTFLNTPEKSNKNLLPADFPINIFELFASITIKLPFSCS